MKTKLIMANWLLSLVLLTSAEGSLALTVALMVYFLTSSFVVYRCRRQACTDMEKWNMILEKFLSHTNK